jgi:uncharacterized damage-inducible protein DinB
MHPRLAELIAYADTQRAAVLAAVERVPRTLRDRPPAGGGWSVAQVLEHLNRVERGVTRVVSRRLEQARGEGLDPETETGSLLGSLDRFDLIERKDALPSPEFVRPEGRLSAQAALEALAESRRALRAALEPGDGLALGQVSAPHALFGPLTLYEWVLFVGQHEARHAAQIASIARRVTAA